MVTDKQLIALRQIANNVDTMPRIVRDGKTFIKTGLNSNTVCNLKIAGLISVSVMYLRGITAEDLQVTEAGKALVR
jgi:hypothetical protein